MCNTGQCLSCQNNNASAANTASYLQTMQMAQNLTQKKTTDYDYVLFKRYAHLTEGEMIEEYYRQAKLSERQRDIIIEGTKNSFQQESDDQKKMFLEWCQKYHKNIDADKLERMKYFL